MRVAAVGDLHVGLDSVGTIRPSLRTAGQEADVLVIAGDLTQHGSPEEGAVLARELTGLAVPIVAVFGNHDYQQDAENVIRRDLEQSGVIVLEGESTVVRVDGRTIGIAGVKGFGGGFAGACATEFGEPEMKAFIRETKKGARQLRESLAGLATDVRVALTHYAPTATTLKGERLEIYPFLGSYLLGEAIDSVGCDLAVHGHAHLGTEHGVTLGGVPVRNVARTVIRRGYKVYCLGGRKDPAPC